jgi:hypothetical protein
VSLTGWFRKHRRHLLAAVVVMLMFSWGVLGNLQRYVTRTQGSYGTVRGKAVTFDEMQDSRDALRMARQLGLGDPRMLSMLSRTNVSPQTVALIGALNWLLGEQVFGASDQPDSAGAWRYLVLLREAQAGGVEVTPAQAGEILSAMPVFSEDQVFSERRYEAFVQVSGLTHAAVISYVQSLASVAQLLDFVSEATLSSNAEVWMDYGYRNEQVRMRFVQVPTSAFLPLIKATDEELRAFYEKRKDALPDPAAGAIGYKGPERVKLECAVAPAEELAKQAQVTEEDIAAYYKDKKAEFLTEAKKPEGAAPESGSQAAPAAPGQDAAEKTESVPPGFRYQPLEEVRDQIRQKLAGQKAQARSQEFAQQVVDDLRSLGDQYTNEPRPLGQIARRRGLTCRVLRNASGQELVSRQDLESAFPQAMDLVDFAFGKESNLYYPKMFRSQEGTLVCQVLERRPSAVEPFEQVVEQVRRDCLAQKALERATAFAENLRQAVVKDGFENAVQEMNVRLAGLLAGAQGQVAGAAGQQPAVQQLEVRESDLFKRSDTRVPGIEGPVPAVVAVAFRAPVGQIATAVQGPPASLCYVIQPFGAQQAAQQGFADNGALLSMYYLFDKRAVAVREWLDHLFEAAQPTARVTG